MVETDPVQEKWTETAGLLVKGVQEAHAELVASYSNETTPAKVRIKSRSVVGIMNQDSANSPYYSCFISYSSKDEEFAKKLHDDLKAAGVECWYAPEDMRIGDKV